VPGGRSVDQDQVGDALLLDLLDLAEDEDVADPGDRPGHDVDDPGRQESLGEALHPVVVEVFEQSVVGRDGPGVDDAWWNHRPLVDRPGSQVGGAGGVQHLTGIAEPPGTAEGGRDPGPALQLDHQDGQAGAGGQVGQCGHHGGLADTALAGHDQDPALAAEGADVHDAPSVVSAFAGPAPPQVGADFGIPLFRIATHGAKAAEFVAEPPPTSCFARRRGVRSRSTGCTEGGIG
jgi:hypothetical protein